jgi:superfamily II RNA helicase
MLYDVQDGSVRDVHSVILDEFHYMNDKSRGTVWEESVIYSPPELSLVALSATMRNVRDIRDWFAEVHGPTDLGNLERERARARARASERASERARDRQTERQREGTDF